MPFSFSLARTITVSWPRTRSASAQTKAVSYGTSNASRYARIVRKAIRLHLDAMRAISKEAQRGYVPPLSHIDPAVRFGAYLIALMGPKHVEDVLRKTLNDVRASSVETPRGDRAHTQSGSAVQPDVGAPLSEVPDAVNANATPDQAIEIGDVDFPGILDDAQQLLKEAGTLERLHPADAPGEFDADQAPAVRAAIREAVERAQAEAIFTTLVPRSPSRTRLGSRVYTVSYPPFIDRIYRHLISHAAEPPIVYQHLVALLLGLIIQRAQSVSHTAASLTVEADDEQRSIFDDDYAS